MLTIEPPFYQIRGVTIFRDHEDADLFYYLPAAPRLALTATNNELDFKLFKYRRDLTDNPALEPMRARGAGLAEFATEIPLDHAAALESDLAGVAGREHARLVPVMFRAGSVQAIVAHTAGDQLIDDLVESHKAPLVSPYHAAFMLALTAEGATLFEAAARGGQLPVGVLYQMSFLALTPSLHARVTMDYDRMYDRFSTSLGFTYYVSVRLDVELSWLMEHGLVKIEITAFTDTADRERQEKLVMDLVKARITQDFFRSGMPPEPGEGLSGPLGEMLGNMLGKKTTSSSALFVLKAKLEVQREKKDFELIFNGRTAVELSHIATGFLYTITAGGAPPSIQEIDLDDRFFSSLKVQIHSTADFEEMADLVQMLVHVEKGEFHKSFPFTRAEGGPYVFEAPLTRPADDEYSYRVEYHFDADVGGRPLLIQAGPYKTRLRALVIDPLAHFRYLRLRVRLGPIDPKDVPRVRVHLRVPDPDGGDDLARSTVELDAQHPDQLWRQRFPMAFTTLKIRARTEWEDAHGEAHDMDDEAEVFGVFMALGPYRDLLAITVQQAVNWDAVTQVETEFRYQDGNYLVERQLVFDAGHKGSQRIEIPLLRHDARKYQWRQLVFHTDGTAAKTEWAESDVSLLLAGAEPSTTGSLRVVWVGDPGDALGLRIDFWAVNASGDEENTSVFLRSRQDTEKTVTLPLDRDGRLHYRYEVKRYTADSEETVRTGQGETNLLVVR